MHELNYEINQPPSVDPGNESIESELADAKLLQRLSMELIHEDGTAGLYHKIMDAAVVIMRSEYASMQVLYPEKDGPGKLRLIASRGFTEDAKKYWEWVTADTISCCSSALRAGHRVIIPDMHECDFLRETDSLRAYLHAGFYASQSTPLFSRSGKLLGMLSTQWSEPRHPTERDLRMLDFVARQAADLIERTTTAEALKLGEEKLRAFTTATSDVIYHMSADWKEMYQLDGRNLLAHTGEPIKDWLDKYIYRPDHKLVLDAIDQAIRTRSVFQLEHRVILADGGVGWTLSRAVPIMDSDGNILEWFGAASDVTLRKQTEDALRIARDEADRRKRLYEAITASTPDLMYVFSLDYRFTYANDALLKMWGRSWNDSIGKGLRDLGYEEWHAEMHEREIDEVATTKRPIRGEVSFPHAELGRRIYDYIFVPVLDEDGKVEAVAGTTRDITEIKMAEETRKSLLTELEHRVDERTKELQRSNEDLQQFAHVASHDLKEPVRKIKTYAYRLQDEMTKDFNEKSKSYLDRILNSAERMSSMIEGVLTYSTFDSNDQNFAEVNLNKILTDILQDLELVIQQKDAVIESQTLPSVQGVEVLLHQLFYNLINNSLKFSKQDEKPRITISASEIDINHIRHYQIRVADNGIGFEPEYNKKIFETFSRLNPRNKYDGTGLGLSLCKKTVERHGGTIESHGKENEGAMFVINLPVLQNAKNQISDVD